MVGQGDWPRLHGTFEPGEERADGGRLLLLCGWFEVLQAQVPEPVGDEAQAVGSDLVSWLHLVGIVVDPGDEAHLKHNEST